MRIDLDLLDLGLVLRSMMMYLELPRGAISGDPPVVYGIGDPDFGRYW